MNCNNLNGNDINLIIASVVKLITQGLSTNEIVLLGLYLTMFGSQITNIGIIETLREGVNDNI